MLCSKCVHWTVELFTYESLQNKWDSIISKNITVGYKEKFKKESERLQTDFQSTELYYKYCARGLLDRFYIMRNPRDPAPRKEVNSCPGFSTDMGSHTIVQVPGPFWRICCTESHGVSKIKDQLFFPGLYENGSYFRIPAHGNIRPELINHGCCKVCGEVFNRGLRITEKTDLCCNPHYLQWWAGRHPDVFSELIKR